MRADSDRKPLTVRRTLPRRALSALLLLAAAFATLPAGLPAPAAAQGATGLPLPRFVSLKASRVNVRIGPSNGHDVKWVFVRAGLPVEIVQEFENWRRIRDSSGAEGWVYHALLSGRRTALVAPWQAGEPIELRSSATTEAPVRALLEPRVVTVVAGCDGTWCHVEGQGFDGYIRQDTLWGVYPNETFD